jgi:hypothetical protein
MNFTRSCMGAVSFHGMARLCSPSAKTVTQAPGPLRQGSCRDFPFEILGGENATTT